MPKLIPLLALALTAAFLPATRAEEPKKEAAKPPTFTVPKGWETAERKSDIVHARFQSGEGAKAVAVVVTGVGGDGGGLAPNVNRWRSQIGLDALDETAAVKALQPVKVDGIAGHVLDATGPDVAGKISQRVVVALVRKDDQTWYFRMSGPAAEVGAQKTAFDEFVKSVRFPK